MLTLHPGEKILLTLHHHWISIVGPALFTFFFLIFPLAVFPFARGAENAELLVPFFFLLSSLWLLIILLIGLSLWIDWYLDSLIVTTERVVNINQEGLFRHEVSEFRLERVQDVTIEVPHFLATILGYGNLTIQTAGEINFSIKEIPRVKEAKDAILKYSKRGYDVGAFTVGSN